MKTLLKASGIGSAIAFMSAIGLVGCGADMGAEGASGEGAEIGSVEQAIAKADIVTSGSMAVGRSFHSLCKVTINSVDYLIAAGGEVANGVYSDDTEVLKTTTDTWFSGANFNNKLPAEVAFASMIQDPDDPASCLHFNGELANGTVQAAVRKLTVTVDGSGNPTGVTSANPLSSGTLVARSKFQLLPCGTGNLAIIGGKGAATSGLQSIQVYNSGAVDVMKNVNGTPATVALGTGRSDFAAAVRPDNLGISIAGGIDASANKTNDVESMLLTSACALDSTSATTPTAHPDNLTVARSGLRMWYRDTASARDTFVVAVGDSAGGGSAVTETVLIDFTDLANSTATVNNIAATLSADFATSNPAFAFVSGKGYLIGGIDSGTRIAEAQEYDLAGAPDWTSDDQDVTNAFLPVREGGAAVAANSRVYAVGGKSAAATYLTNTIKITP